MSGMRQPTLENDEPTPPAVEDGVLASLEVSGWRAHPSERGDFYHRIRVFPPEGATWRQELLCHVQEHPERFPRAATDRERLTAQVDEGLSFLREVARILAVLYGSPDLGNKQDPTDELVYILLA